MIRFYIISIFFVISIVDMGRTLVSVGCFKKSEISGFEITSDQKDGRTATLCISKCKISNMFAGLYNGESCWCGETYGVGANSNQCNYKCLDDKNETCGGLSLFTIYETGANALNHPQGLEVIDRLDNALHIKWRPPVAHLTDIKDYEVMADPVFYFTEKDHPKAKNYRFSPLTQTAYLDGLHSGVRYKIKINAISKKGSGYPAEIEAWTTVGVPERPAIPKLLSRFDSTMVVKLEEVMPIGGPISNYQVVVVDESLPVVINFDLLSDYHSSLSSGLPYYVAAEFNKDKFVDIFTVGDGQAYGKFINAPLKSKVDYHILLGVQSTINETKSAYSQSTHLQHTDTNIEGVNTFDISTFHKSDDSTNGDNLILILIIAISLFGFLLLASIFVYFALRAYFKRKTRRHVTEHQELAVHAHVPNQDYDNGYSIAAHYLEDEEMSPDHYRLLRERVPIFPHQNINIVAEIGIGEFGVVKKGIINDHGSDRKQALVHQIEDKNLVRNKKSIMLKEFDIHIKIAKHPNIVGLLGLMEDLNVISIVFEYETTSFKSFILESRAIERYPVYAEKNRRFSTLPEAQLLQILHGISSGLYYLSSCGFTHGSICTRNISMKDGIVPKITGFNLLKYHNDVYIPDHSRWISPEVSRSQKLTIAGDIWSFGILMWEAATLGGTPYCEVKSEELITRIGRGLRLPQPQYLSDELYQLMLLCWQTDPGERPSFLEIESSLERLSKDDVVPHILFSLYPAFMYERYCPHLEFVD